MCIKIRGRHYKILELPVDRLSSFIKGRQWAGTTTIIRSTTSQVIASYHAILAVSSTSNVVYEPSARSPLTQASTHHLGEIGCSTQVQDPKVIKDLDTIISTRDEEPRVM